MVSLKNIENELRNLYETLISETKSYRHRKSNHLKVYVLFGALTGKFYQKDGTMFIGRSPYGWHCFVNDEKIPNLFANEKIVKEDEASYVDSVDKPLFDIPGKLTLLKNVNQSSKVWQLLKILGENLYKEDWEQHIVYSNYCKIAPDENSGSHGTPPVGLRNIQEKIVDKILRLELDSFKPKHIIVYTGLTLKNIDFSERIMHMLLSYFSGETDTPKYSKRWVDYRNVRLIEDDRIDCNLLEIYKIGDRYIYLLDHPERHSPKKQASSILKAKELGYW